MSITKDTTVLSRPTFVVHEYGTTEEEFSWSVEMRHLLSSNFLGVICWPLFTFRQRYITKSRLLKTCLTLPGFPNLWKTIQKGSFAYNTLLLRLTPVKSKSNITDLADLTTLALFFGDEFIDGVCAAAGKPCIKQLFHTNPADFYLRVTQCKDNIKIVFDFNRINDLSPNVFDVVNEKYGISYGALYKLLSSFFDLVNEQLLDFPLAKRKMVATKIIDVCNNCLESYLHDVMHSPAQDNIIGAPYHLNFHECKTRLMQKKLLELRCLLADKEHVLENQNIDGWLNIMSVVQIYDDMQDVVIDDGFQDNMVLYTARHYFIDEWKWFAANKKLLAQSRQAAFLLSLNMPCSIQACLKEATRYINMMTWEQQKIMHYLLRKNWFISSGKNIQRGKDQVLYKHKSYLFEIYDTLIKKMANLPDEAIKAYALETCFHQFDARKYVLSKVSCTTAYQLRYNLLSLTARQKAKIFDSIVTAKTLK